MAEAGAAVTACASHGFGWGQAVTWLIVIVGWIVVDRLNNAREGRKDLRSQIDAVTELLREIETDAVKYHCTGHSEELAHGILRKLKRMNGTIQILSERGIHPKGRGQIELRRAVTLKNFQTKEYKQLSPGDLQITEIGVSCDNIERALERAYSERFHTK